MHYCLSELFPFPYIRTFSICYCCAKMVSTDKLLRKSDFLGFILINTMDSKCALQMCEVLISILQVLFLSILPSLISFSLFLHMQSSHECMYLRVCVKFIPMFATKLVVRFAGYI